VPVPLAKGTPGEGYPWPWSVYQWLEGENPTIEHISEFGSLATEIAQFVTALHSINLTGGPAATRGVPLKMRDDPTRSAIKELEEIIDTNAVTTVWDAALQIPVWSELPAWVHGDLSPGNLLCINHKLSAVIDFGGLGMGDPACDLIVAWNLLPANMRNTFHAALKVDDDTWMRGRGWALSVALIQLPYYLKTSPVIVSNAQHVIHEILADYKYSK
jgi:aminoglycoside phosphotransferase (APT) family kinase protein